MVQETFEKIINFKIYHGSQASCIPKIYRWAEWITDLRPPPQIPTSSCWQIDSWFTRWIDLRYSLQQYSPRRLDSVKHSQTTAVNISSTRRLTTTSLIGYSEIVVAGACHLTGAQTKKNIHIDSDQSQEHDILSSISASFLNQCLTNNRNLTRRNGNLVIAIHNDSKFPRYDTMLTC